MSTSVEVLPVIEVIYATDESLKKSLLAGAADTIFVSLAEGPAAGSEVLLVVWVRPAISPIVLRGTVTWRWPRRRNQSEDAGVAVRVEPASAPSLQFLRSLSDGTRACSSRVAPRVAARAPVSLTIEGQEHWGWLRDVSMLGAFVELHTGPVLLESPDGWPTVSPLRVGDVMVPFRAARVEEHGIGLEFRFEHPSFLRSWYRAFAALVGPSRQGLLPLLAGPQPTVGAPAPENGSPTSLPRTDEGTRTARRAPASSDAARARASGKHKPAVSTGLTSPRS